MTTFSGLPNNETWYDSIQGNILKPHGRNFHFLIFLSFADLKDKDSLLKWISNLPITSFKKQLEDSIRYRSNQQTDIFTSFYLSASGYKNLGFSQEQMPSDPSFIQGMKTAGKKLKDISVDLWDEQYQKTIDAVILIAHDNDDELFEERKRLP